MEPTAQVYFFVTAALFPGIVVLTKYSIFSREVRMSINHFDHEQRISRLAEMNFSAPSPREPTIDILIMYAYSLQISSSLA